jgi:hypothetical protein
MSYDNRGEVRGMSHIVLLGDSIFDNAAYVADGPDVVRQLQARLSPGMRATLCAVDGSTAEDVARQLAQVPPDATHLVVSAGGNDALGHMSILDEDAIGLDRLATIRETFESAYRTMLDGVLGLRLPTAVCTIYHPRFPEPELRRLGATGLTHFNDAIAAQAFAHGLPLIDLRHVCDDDADFANPIEPSVIGGEKIAAAIARLVAEHDFARRRTEVFTR